MRVSGQLVVVAVLGAAGLGGWYAYKAGALDQLPVIGFSSTPSAPKAAAADKSGRGGTSGPPVVDVDTVKTGHIIETREAVGTIRAYESIVVTTKIAGVISEIDFQEGQQVKNGDMLVQLDAAERKADIEQAIAEEAKAVAQRDEVAIKLDRAQTLSKTGAGTGAQVDDLAAQVKSLDGAIASAQAQRKAAEARLDDLTIKAPFNGRVGTRSVSLGAYVSPETRVTSLDDLSKVRLDFSVPENLLAQLKPGQIVDARSVAYADRIFKGKVAIIDPRVDPVTRTVRLTADFDNPDEALRPGMFMSVALEVTNKDNAVLVPEEAIVSEGLRQVVYPVKDNKIERRVIQIGMRQNGKVEVASGLKSGETIVVLGVQRVRAGLEVVPHQIGMPEAPSNIPAAGRAQPSRSSLNLPVITPAAAAEQK